jgi:diaminopimelate decarboxylase
VRDLPRWAARRWRHGRQIRLAAVRRQYTALLANRAEAVADEVVNVAGRYCESGDFLLKETALAQPPSAMWVALSHRRCLYAQHGQQLQHGATPVRATGAPGHVQVMRRRESYADLWRHDGV